MWLTICIWKVQYSHSLNCYLDVVCFPQNILHVKTTLCDLITAAVDATALTEWLFRVKCLIQVWGWKSRVIFLITQSREKLDDNCALGHYWVVCLHLVQILFHITQRYAWYHFLSHSWTSTQYLQYWCVGDIHNSHIYRNHNAHKIYLECLQGSRHFILQYSPRVFMGQSCSQITSFTSWGVTMAFVLHILQLWECPFSIADAIWYAQNS